MPLNQQSPIPLYRQLADQIRTQIDEGVHPIDAKIPSENELARSYSIGRPTVRQATDLLVRQGKLERRRGSGTFVLPPNQSIDLFSLTGTSAAFRNSALNAELKLTTEPVLECVPAQNVQSAQVPPPEDNEEFLRVERCASVDDVPVLYETLWLSTTLFPGLHNHNLENQSLSALVRDVYFLEPSSADQAFFVINANEKQAKQLQTQIATPLLRVHRQLHFGDYQSALHAEILCLTDRFEFSQTLYPANAKHDASTTSS
ncbi:MAG: GntR family transcriptional regulator [Granulosicoccus sp.]